MSSRLIRVKTLGIQKKKRILRAARKTGQFRDRNQ
jgi:hypothetical protein